ncbi:MAG: helix-turn-helix transcriptional regulator [Flavobacterium sp.]|nr:helix-turn-helix transcriptional regulator [Flavobacterium sp.]MCZ8169293.1 helix-turn-helix transcriptional regulator [Flavobacterium sp.]
MNRTKLSQQDIANALQVDRNTIANWEKGENDIKSEYIPQLATLLGVEIKDLFEKESKSIKIGHNENIGKENSILNGAIIILNDKESVEKLVAIVQNSLRKE